MQEVYLSMAKRLFPYKLSGMCGKEADMKGKQVFEAVSSKTASGQSIQGILPALRECVTDTKCYGRSAEEQAAVYQWLEYALVNADREDVSEKTLAELNSHFVDKVFLVSNIFTIADVVLYILIHSTMAKLSFLEKEKYMCLSRWFKQVQHEVGLKGYCPEVTFSKTPLYT